MVSFTSGLLLLAAIEWLVVTWFASSRLEAPVDPDDPRWAQIWSRRWIRFMALFLAMTCLFCLLVATAGTSLAPSLLSTLPAMVVLAGLLIPPGVVGIMLSVALHRRSRDETDPF